MKAAVAAVAIFLTGCVYYNGLWRAERFASEARRLEERGRAAEARVAWARARVKAESVLSRHPSSRWADDALVLKGEGLAGIGACDAGAAVLEEARRTVQGQALLERASLAGAACALRGGNPVAAVSLLANVVGSADGGRRDRAALLMGDAALARGDGPGALEWYARSPLPAAAFARARALLALGRHADLLDALSDLGRRPATAPGWAELLGAVARATGADTASLALDRLLSTGASRLPAGEQGRLLLEDGDRLRAAGRLDAAATRYAAVNRLVPDSAEGALAVVRRVRARAGQAGDTAALRLALAELGPEPSGGAGPGTAERRALAAVLTRVLDARAGPAARFHAAELARDSLGARDLARLLFLDLARRRPESVFAPKGLVAALALDAEPRDSILGVLNSAYASSPYTLALAGVATPAYAVLEDSLARAAGITTRPARVTGSRVAPPVTGPRGPALDEAPAPPARRERRAREPEP